MTASWHQGPPVAGLCRPPAPGTGAKIRRSGPWRCTAAHRHSGAHSIRAPLRRQLRRQYYPGASASSAYFALALTSCGISAAALFMAARAMGLAFALVTVTTSVSDSNASPSSLWSRNSSTSARA
jgi:hypothetical protein